MLAPPKVPRLLAILISKADRGIRTLLWREIGEYAAETERRLNRGGYRSSEIDQVRVHYSHDELVDDVGSDVDGVSQRPNWC